MVGHKNKKNKTIRPNFKAYLGRHVADTNHAEFNMLNQGVGGYQAAGSKWLQIDTSYWGETDSWRFRRSRVGRV
jgi:hypothetical protein